MKLKELRNKKWFKIVSNKYVLLILIFGGWMLFLDSNSWLVHNELNQEIDELEENACAVNCQSATGVGWL